MLKSNAQRWDSRTKTGTLPQPQAQGRTPSQPSPKFSGSSSLLVTIFERTSWFQSVDRRNPQKRTMTHNYLEYKDFSHSFTKSAEDPNGIKLACELLLDQLLT
jgi:hypothetical protein